MHHLENVECCEIVSFRLIMIGVERQSITEKGVLKTKSKYTFLVACLAMQNQVLHCPFLPILSNI